MMLTKCIQNKGRRLLGIMLSGLLGLSLCAGFAPLTAHAEDIITPDSGQTECTAPITLTCKGETVDLSQAYLKRTDLEEENTYPLTEVTNGAAIPEGTYSIYIPDIETGSDIVIQGTELKIEKNTSIDFTAEYFCIRFIDIDGTALLDKQLVAAGGRFSEPQIPVHDGYDWIGWASAPGGEIVNLPVEIERDYTFYGIWKAPPAPIEEPAPADGLTPDPEPKHVHTYELKNDDTEHWQECITVDGICDAKETDRSAHDFDDGTVTKEATKSEDGTRVFKCNTCGYTRTEVIPKLPHEHTYVWKSNDTEHWQECTSAEGICDIKVIEQAAHSFGNGTITKEATEENEGEKILICGTCSYSKKEVVPRLPHTHKYGTEWKSDDVSHWHECPCGGRNETAPHTAGDWIVDTKPTVSAEGSRHKECTSCKKILLTEAIPKLIPPKITAGVGQIFQRGSTSGITITCSGSLENLTGVYVNNELVHPGNYTVSSGSTILTLHPAYLESLSGGTHTVKLAYSDGTSAETQFTIQKAGAVKTGDMTNYIPLMILLILSVGVLIVTTIIRKRGFKG